MSDRATFRAGNITTDRNPYFIMIKSEEKSEVAQSCPTLCDPMDWGLQGFSIHGIFQARILKWGAISFSSNDKRGQLSNKT